MRVSTKERLKLLAATAILAVPGLFAFYQLWSAFSDGLVLWPIRRRGELITWLSYEADPLSYVGSLFVYGLLALLFAVVLAAAIAMFFSKDRWRSRQFIDHAIRRPLDPEM